MFTRRFGIAGLLILSLAACSFAMDYAQFRQAAVVYEDRMMQGVQTLTITGTRTIWQKDQTGDFHYNAAFTDVVKAGKWRRETRALIPVHGDMRFEKTPVIGVNDGSVKAHPAPPAADHSPCALGDNPPPKKSPPPPPPPPASKDNPPPPASKSTPPPANTSPAPQPAPQPAPPPANTSPAPQPFVPINTAPAPAPTPPPPAAKDPGASTSGYNKPAPLPPTSRRSAKSRAPRPRTRQTADSVVTARVFDGKDLWEAVNKTVNRIDQPEPEDLRAPTVPGHDYWYELEGYQSMMVTSEVWRTRDCWKLEADSLTLWVDKKDFCLCAMEKKAPLDKQPTRTECSNFFRIADGYTIPGQIDHYVGDRLVETESISDVLFNRYVGDDLFVMGTSGRMDSKPEVPPSQRDGGVRVRH